MEKLIKFILDNLMFVIIAAGFLFSILRKRVPKQGEPHGRTGPTGGMPPFAGDSPGGPTWGGGPGRTTAKRAPGVQRAERAPEPSRERMAEPEPARMVSGDRAIPASTFQPEDMSNGQADSFHRNRSSSGARTDGARYASNAAQSSGIPGFSADEAVKGVIWAEVFGPPRAKRPFPNRR